MLKAYKYNIIPSEEQEQQLSQIFGCTRFVFNLGLETKITSFKLRGNSPNCFDLIKQMKELKDTETPWLKDCPSQALQMALRNLDNAYTNLFRGGGFPRFKSKHKRQSFQLPQGVRVDFEKGKIFLPKLKWVDCVFSREFKGEIKTVTVTKTPTNKYFVSIVVETGVAIPKKKPLLKETAVGIDLGIKDFAITSDAVVFPNHKYLTNTLKRLRVEQRSLSRKMKGSANRYKQKLVVAKLHEKIRNQRYDFLHKVSTAIVKQYDTICMEDLNVKGMMKNKKLSRSIGEVGWSEFYRMIEYKSEWFGKNRLQIGRFDPSSKICNICGAYNHQLKLSDRTWTCRNGHVLERDHNAAINIRDSSFRTEALPVNVGR